MPAGAVYVGRPSKWGNPFPFGVGVFSRGAVVDEFRRLLKVAGAFWPPLPGEKAAPTTVDDIKRELRGRDLACWCPLDQPCHADVLLEIANS